MQVRSGSCAQDSNAADTATQTGLRQDETLAAGQMQKPPDFGKHAGQNQAHAGMYGQPAIECVASSACCLEPSTSVAGTANNAAAGCRTPADVNPDIAGNGEEAGTLSWREAPRKSLPAITTGSQLPVQAGTRVAGCYELVG